MSPEPRSKDGVGNAYGASHVDGNGTRAPGSVELDAAAYLGRRVAAVTARLTQLSRASSALHLARRLAF